MSEPGVCAGGGNAGRRSAGCETKAAGVSAVCRPGGQVTAPARWQYPGEVDASVITQIPRAIDIVLHYPGATARAVPDDPAKQEAQVGITAATPLFTTTRAPPSQGDKS